MNIILSSPISENGGWAVALVGYTIVFIALVFLILIFTQLPKLLKMKVRFTLRKKGHQVANQKEDYDVEGNVSAAISMALYMYFSKTHDDESHVMTINRIQRRYSPWSSKIYSIYSSNLIK